MKPTNANHQHPVLKTALAAAIACPVVLGAAVALPAQPAYASYYYKTLHAGETFEHTVVSKQPDILKIGVAKTGYVRLKISVSNDADNGLSGIQFEPSINDVSQETTTLTAGREVTTNAIAVGPDQNLTIRVESFGFCTEMPYTIKVIAFTPDGLETEPNDTFGEADELVPGIARYGLLAGDENDFYSFEADKEGLYALKLKLSAGTDSDARINPTLKVDDNPTEELDSFSGKHLTTICTKALRRGQRATIALANPFGRYRVQSFYQIKLTRKEIPVPQLKSLAGGHGALSATWKKTSKHADGYQIRWSTSKSMRNARKKLLSGTKKTSTTLKGLESKKRYYVQTRAYYVDYDRETGWHKQRHFFTWSKAKSAKTK